VIPIKPSDPNTIPLNPPKDWDQSKGKCDTLHVVVIPEFAGQPGLASLWQPSADEVRSIIDGHPVMLIVCGTQHPPVSLVVADNPDRVLREAQ
jgi:hypothetical protein